MKLALGITVFGTMLMASPTNRTDSAAIAVEKGMHWLVSVQGKDGGWGQDGGETSYVRQGERLESNGNDVANTAVAARALFHSGARAGRREYNEPLPRAVGFFLAKEERNEDHGFAISGLHRPHMQRQ